MVDKTQCHGGLLNYDEIQYDTTQIQIEHITNTTRIHLFNCITLRCPSPDAVVIGIDPASDLYNRLLLPRLALLDALILKVQFKQIGHI